MVLARLVRVGTLVPDSNIQTIIQCYAKKSFNTSSKTKEEVTYAHDDGYQVIFTLKKKFVSDAHRAAFEQSLEWQDEGGSIRLRKYSEAEVKKNSFKYVGAALSKDKGDVRYQCSICLEWHKLDLVAGTTVLEL